MAFNKARLISLRNSRNLTRNRLAWETFICRSVLGRIEKGEITNPAYETVQVLADYFNVNIESFRKGIEA